MRPSDLFSGTQLKQLLRGSEDSQAEKENGTARTCQPPALRLYKRYGLPSIAASGNYPSLCLNIYDGTEKFRRSMMTRDCKPNPSSGGGSSSSTIASTESILLLASPDDQSYLSPSFCLLREQIEIFPADTPDVIARRRRGGQKDPISVGRVGLRCAHCRHVSHAGRARGAIMYPNKMSLIYQATRNFQRYHLNTCPHMPPEVISIWAGMKRQHAANNSEKYWITSAEAKGLVDVTPPTTKKGSGHRGTKLAGPENGIRFRHGFDWAPLCVSVPLMKKEPHDVEAEASEMKRGRKRSLDGNESAGAGVLTQSSHHLLPPRAPRGRGDPSTSLPRVEEGVGDALDTFLHSIDETYEAGPNDPPAQHSMRSGIATDLYNTNGTSNTYASAATFPGSAFSSADFEPIPFSSTSQAAGSNADLDANMPINNHQLDAFGQTQWTGHSSDSVGSSSTAAAFQPPPLIQPQQEEGRSEATFNNNQSEELLAEAADNIAQQRELLKQLFRN